MKIQNLQEKKWYIIDSEAKCNSSTDEEIQFLTRSIESSLRDYSDAYILVTGNINVTRGDANTKVAFKNCAPFDKCRTEINGIFGHNAQHINIVTVILIHLVVYGSLKEMK